MFCSLDGFHLRVKSIQYLIAWVLHYHTKRLAKKNPSHFVVQSDVKPKLIMTLTLIFPHFSSATILASSSDWFVGLTVSFVIGLSDFLGFGFTRLI